MIDQLDPVILGFIIGMQAASGGGARHDRSRPDDADAIAGGLAA